MIDGITLDMTDLTDQTLTTFSVTAASQYQLTLGQSVSVLYGYYIGGFTDETSGAQLATETYVPVGTLTATVVPVSNGSLTGLLFTGKSDWLQLAQSWADDPSTNYEFVFPSTTFASLVPANGGDLYTREKGQYSAFRDGHIRSGHSAGALNLRGNFRGRCFGTRLTDAVDAGLEFRQKGREGAFQAPSFSGSYLFSPKFCSTCGCVF